MHHVNTPQQWREVLGRRRNRLAGVSIHGAADELRHLASLLHHWKGLESALQRSDPSDSEGLAAAQTWSEVMSVASGSATVDQLLIPMGDGTADERWRRYVANRLETLFCFLEEQALPSMLLTDLLDRYCRRVALVDADVLGDQLRSGKGERECQRDLYRFLIEHGLPLTMREPPTGRARPDLLTFDRGNALPIEVKVVRGRDDATEILNSGVAQVAQYAAIQRCVDACLVAFSLDRPRLLVRAPLVLVGGVRVWVATLDVGRTPTPSEGAVEVVL